MRVYILIGAVLLTPALALAEPDSTFALLFARMNEAWKNRDVPALLPLISRTQRHLIEQCLAEPSCGKPFMDDFDSGTLVTYTVLRVDTLRAKNWIAYELHFQGTEVTGKKVVGSVIYIKQDGQWRADTISIGPAQ